MGCAPALQTPQDHRESDSNQYLIPVPITMNMPGLLSLWRAPPAHHPAAPRGENLQALSTRPVSPGQAVCPLGAIDSPTDPGRFSLNPELQIGILSNGNQRLLLAPSLKAGSWLPSPEKMLSQRTKPEKCSPLRTFRLTSHWE